MTKNDFLNQLRITLNGELPETEIDSNLKFYEDYINTKNRETEENNVMEQLGDPRLIGKTIIETYQMSHAPLYRNDMHNSAYQDVNATEEPDYKNRYMGNSLKWYQKLSLILIVITIIVVLAVVGGILIRLFFSIGIPLIIIYLLYKGIVKNSK